MEPNRIRLIVTRMAVASLVTLGIASVTFAQDPATKPAPSSAAAQPAPEGVDPKAVAALERMGGALRKLQQYGVIAETTSEVVMDDGEKVQLDGKIGYKIREPNMLFADVSSDRRQRIFYYDGKDLTLWSPRLKFYGQIEGINASLRDLATRLKQNQGIELPLFDLFLWGTPAADTSKLSVAAYVGPGTVEGVVPVEHYIFRQPGVDWQVWIEKSTQLPRKLVITNKQDPERPQYTARMHWDTNASFVDDTFRFAPPKDAQEIAIAGVIAAPAQTQEK